MPVANGKFRFHPTLRGHPDSLALRIAVGLSHYTIYDAVFGVRDGKVIRKRGRSVHLKSWLRDRLNNAEQVHRFNVRRFWRRVRGNGMTSLYRPYELE